MTRPDPEAGGETQKQSSFDIPVEGNAGTHDDGSFAKDASAANDSNFDKNVEATLPLRPFDPYSGLEIYELYLPHWRQKGVTYFVTFRLGDSLPKALLDRWFDERAAWLHVHGLKSAGEVEKLPPKERYEYHKRFTAKLHEWLDAGHGKCWLRRPDAAAIIAAAMRHFDLERYTLGDWVVMPNHVHVIVTPAGGHELADILKAWKGYASNEINKLLNRTGKFWQKESFDHIVRSAEQLAHYQRYIRENPLKAKLRLGAYLLSKRAK